MEGNTICPHRTIVEYARLDRSWGPPLQRVSRTKLGTRCPSDSRAVGEYLFAQSQLLVVPGRLFFDNTQHHVVTPSEVIRPLITCIAQLGAAALLFSKNARPWFRKDLQPGPDEDGARSHRNSEWGDCKALSDPPSRRCFLRGRLHWSHPVRRSSGRPLVRERDICGRSCWVPHLRLYSPRRVLVPIFGKDD
jgi:hypothetical protein